MFNRFRGAPIMIAATVCSVFGLSGCSSIVGERVSVTHTERVNQTMTGPLAINVVNYHGPVKVVVDRSIERPEVSAKYFPLHDDAKEGGANATSVTSDIQPSDSGDVLVVTSTSPWEDETFSKIEITIRTPECDGVNVRTRGGLVDLFGVSGPIDVENGALGGNPGSVYIRTLRPILDPVTVYTDKGFVVAQISPKSECRLELFSRTDAPELRGEGGRFTSEASNGAELTATLNGGTALVKLSSDDGRVRVKVSEDAERYLKRWY